MTDELKEMTLEELSHFNGENGAPVYVAYEGHIYDLTESKRWRKGTHMNRHHAGTDLSGELSSAPHTIDLLKKFPIVGTLIAKEEVREDIPGWIVNLLNRFPFLWRHPHPIFVHFPIVAFILSPLFTLLFLYTGYEPFEYTAFHLLGAGILFSVLAVITGFLTWWFNYKTRPMTLVTLKITLSAIVIVTGVIDFIWRWNHPGILDHLAGVSILYLVAVLLLLPLVSIVGWAGAELTFPTHVGGRVQAKKR